jgi:hypothetical protein
MTPLVTHELTTAERRRSADRRRSCDAFVDL